MIEIFVSEKVYCPKIIYFENFRMLLRLLEQSKEPLVLCVAAHDIGEYVRHYPHGKKYVKFFFKKFSLNT
jgi:hypothetical protein